MPIDESGSAFPFGMHPLSRGMSLRDWFAGQVISGSICIRIAAEDVPSIAEKFANAAYVIADEMLKRRSDAN